MAEMSAAMRAFTERAKGDAFDLQTCAACGVVAWPPREACAFCWSAVLEWKTASAAGVILAATTLHVSHEAFFRARLPWRVATVRLDDGPVAYAHLHRLVAEGDTVRIEAHADYRGRGVLIALPLSGGGVDEDPRLFDLVSTREE